MNNNHCLFSYLSQEESALTSAQLRQGGSIGDADAIKTDLAQALTQLFHYGDYLLLPKNRQDELHNLLISNFRKNLSCLYQESDELAEIIFHMLTPKLKKIVRDTKFITPDELSQGGSHPILHNKDLASIICGYARKECSTAKFMQIFMSTHYLKTAMFDVKPETSVKDLKWSYQKRYSIPGHQTLRDDDTMKTFDIKNHDTVHASLIPSSIRP